MTRADARTHARGARVRFLRVDAIAVALLLGILYASLSRYGWVDCRRFRANWLSEWNGLSGSDFLGNVFAYMLLGAALGFSWLARRPGGRAGASAALAAGAVATLAGAALSLSMETAQACLANRSSATFDVVANTGGTALGWLGARLAHPVWSAMLRGVPGRRGEGRLAAVVTVALLAWTLAETAPWVPAGITSVIRENAKASWLALGGGLLDPWRVARAGGEWLAVGFALALALRRPALAVLPFCALVAGILGWRLLLPIGHAPSAAAIVTLPVATLLVLTVPMLGRRACAALALAGALVALLAYQLEPGYGATQAFRWRIALLSGDAIAGIQLACWFGWFATTVVAAGHALDGRPLRWAGIALVVIAASEWAQTTLPGRTPDLSPVAMGLAGAALAVGLLAGHGGSAERRRERPR